MTDAQDGGCWELVVSPLPHRLWLRPHSLRLPPPGSHLGLFQLEAKRRLVKRCVRQELKHGFANVKEVEYVSPFQRGMAL